MRFLGLVLLPVVAAAQAQDDSLRGRRKLMGCPATTTVDFNEFATGEYVNVQTLGPYGFTLSAEAFGRHGYDEEGPRIYDTADPTEDDDLGAPNEDCGGPGIGSGGGPIVDGSPNPFANCQPLGNALIISEREGGAPDDNVDGGRITFDFGDTPRSIKEVGVLDIDKHGSATITLVKSDARVVKDVPQTGNNGFVNFSVNEEDVLQMIVYFSRSGAIPYVTFCDLGTPEPTPSPTGTLITLSPTFGTITPDPTPEPTPGTITPDPTPEPTPETTTPNPTPEPTPGTTTPDPTPEPSEVTLTPTERPSGGPLQSPTPEPTPEGTSPTTPEPSTAPTPDSTPEPSTPAPSGPPRVPEIPDPTEWTNWSTPTTTSTRSSTGSLASLTTYMGKRTTSTRSGIYCIPVSPGVCGGSITIQAGTDVDVPWSWWDFSISEAWTSPEADKSQYCRVYICFNASQKREQESGTCTTYFYPGGRTDTTPYSWGPTIRNPSPDLSSMSLKQVCVDGGNFCKDPSGTSTGALSLGTNSTDEPVPPGTAVITTDQYGLGVPPSGGSTLDVLEVGLVLDLILGPSNETSAAYSPNILAELSLGNRLEIANEIEAVAAAPPTANLLLAVTEADGNNIMVDLGSMADLPDTLFLANPADVNMDGAVEDGDRLLVLQDLSATSWNLPNPRGDVDNDGVVSFADVVSVQENWTGSSLLCT